MLFALLAHPAAWRVKVPPPCQSELRAFVEQKLDGLPAANPYRDASQPALAKEVVDALRPSRWTIFERPLRPQDLMLRIGMIPRVRDWFLWATADDLLVEDAIAEATSLAADRGHALVKVEHFLRVIADQRWLAAPRRLAERLDEVLAGEARRAAAGEEPRLGELLSVLAAQAKVYARMAQRAPTSDILLAIALREDEVKEWFEEASLDIDRLLERIAHGDVAPSVAPASGMVDVVFHNDDFTPIELVKELMERKFQLEPSESKARIASAHDEGEAVIATLPADEARLRVDEARLRAREERLPLRITIRPSVI